MKKIIVLLTALFTLAFSCVSFAADGGDLNKEQRTAEKIMTTLDGDAATAYTGFAPSLSEGLSKSLTQQGFATIQKQTKEQLGSLKNTTFRSFERYNDGDRVIYVAEFSKEKTVAMVFVFDKTAKLVNFSFIPQKPAEQPAEKK